MKKRQIKKNNFNTEDAIQIVFVKTVDGKCKISTKLFSKKEYKNNRCPVHLC
jgi:putative transposon-encoded protein